MEEDDFELINICNEVCADILSEFENDEECNSDDTDLAESSRKRNVLPIISESESSDSEDTILENEQNCSTSNWSQIDNDITVNPFSGNSGVKVFPRNAENISDVVDLFIDDDFFQLLVTETNRYYMQNMHKYKRVKSTKQWRDTTITEIKKFLALNILMGQVKKNNVNDYWTTDPYMETPIFGKIMTRNRFRQILQSLHFCDNSAIPDDASRLVKVESIMQYFIEKFDKVYKPKQNLSLDEAMIPCRGRVSFRVYNPGKITKYGLLVRMLCESDTGYICKFKLYSGNGETLQNLVVNLLDGYENIWHHVYMDNYYNSVQLAQKLLYKKIRICGTIRENRGLPHDLKKITLKQGQHNFRRKGEILIHIWKDKRVVRMISTIHQARMIQTQKINRKTGDLIQKPETILEYNKYMKGVDLADQYLAYNPIIRKTVKWTKKAFMFILNTALFNSFVVFKVLNPGKKIKFSSFLKNIAQNWIEKGYVHSESPGNVSKRVSREDAPMRLSADMRQHKIVKITSSGNKKFPQKRCRVCKKNGKRKETCFMCSYCEIPLCMGKCFEDYHTKKNY